MNEDIKKEMQDYLVPFGFTLNDLMALSENEQKVLLKGWFEAAFLIETVGVLPKELLAMRPGEREALLEMSEELSNGSARLVKPLSHTPALTFTVVNEALEDMIYAQRLVKSGLVAAKKPLHFWKNGEIIQSTSELRPSYSPLPHLRPMGPPK